MSQQALKAFYSCQRYFLRKRVFDKLIVAIDGFETVLPNLTVLLKKFGGTGAKASSPTARMSIAYDVLNDFIMDVAFTP